jgi:Na+-translocating ferredoxin:NAD+ oxidoreductase subunit E
MKKQVTLTQEYIKGIWEINPVFRQLLGLCPTLAVTVTLLNGIAMAVATTFVLVFSTVLVSIFKKLIPSQVRIAAYIVVIATFVTIADLVMKAQFPDMSKALGPFIPLIVVNCLILGRVEAFASKNSPKRALFDALGTGTGFFIALSAMSAVREIIGSRTLLGYQVMPDAFEPWLIMVLPAGAFLTLGLLVGFSNAFVDRRIRLKNKAEQERYRISALREEYKEETL